MSASLKGKGLKKLRYDSIEHNTRINWLRKNAHLTHVNDSMEVSEDGQYITLSVLLDDVVFQRYRKEFDSEAFNEEKRGNYRQAPKGW